MDAIGAQLVSHIVMPRQSACQVNPALMHVCPSKLLTVCAAHASYTLDQL